MTLPEGLFDGLSSLKSLDLGSNSRGGRNGLTTLPVGLFQGLSSLESLVLQGNSLTTLPVGLFEGLDSLKSLDLRYNRLRRLTRDAPLFAAFSGQVDIRL